MATCQGQIAELDKQLEVAGDLKQLKPWLKTLSLPRHAYPDFDMPFQPAGALRDAQAARRLASTPLTFRLWDSGPPRMALQRGKRATRPASRYCSGFITAATAHAVSVRAGPGHASPGDAHRAPATPPRRRQVPPQWPR